MTSTTGSAPSFEAKHVSTKMKGETITLTLELKGLESAQNYLVTPVNPAVVRAAPTTPLSLSDQAADERDSLVKDLRSYARIMRTKEDNQHCVDRDCTEAAEQMEWAALRIEGQEHQLSLRGEPAGYFQKDRDGRFDHIDARYKNDPDVFPLFTAPTTGSAPETDDTFIAGYKVGARLCGTVAEAQKAIIQGHGSSWEPLYRKNHPKPASPAASVPEQGPTEDLNSFQRRLKQFYAPSLLTEHDIGREIFREIKPVNMINADWDSGCVLGADNGLRHSVMLAAKRVIALLAASMGGDRKSTDRLYTMAEMEQYGKAYADARDKRQASKP